MTLTVVPMTLAVAAGPPSGSENPALHWQSVTASLPGGLALEVGHASHSSSLRCVLKVLAGQAAQASE